MRAALAVSSLLALVALAPLARAQQPDAPSAPAVPTGPVREVLLEPALQGEDPWAVTGLQRNQLLDAEVARAALRHALATGTFADARVAVRPLPGGGLVLRVDGERQVRVRELSFSGHSARTLDAVRTDFAVSEGRILTEAERSAAEERLREGYRAAGFLRAEVRSEWRFTDDASVRLLLVTVREGPAVRVRRVVVSGVDQEQAELVRSSAGVGRGDVASGEVPDRVLLAAPLELRRAGYLSALATAARFVPAPGDQADLVVDVRPGPLFRLEWQGVRSFPRGDLEAALRLEEERRVDGTLLPALATRVRDFYVRRGFLDVRVRVEQAVAPDGHTAQLRFVLTENPRVLVGAVEFPGARAITPGRLHDVLREVLSEELPGGQFFQEPGEAAEALLDQNVSAVGRRNPSVRVALDLEHTYVAELYAEAARRMLRRYRDEGYLAATVEQQPVTRYRDVDGRVALRVEFRVREGPQAAVDEVRFEGNRAVPSALLARTAALRAGVPLSSAELERARLRLLEFYRDRAYLFARVESTLDRSPDGAHVRVRVAVREGPEVHVGELVLRGNNRTLASILRQRVLLRRGGLFLPAVARETQRLLGELGIFSGVSVGALDPDVESPVKDLLVQVQEQTPQFLELRAGLSTGEGLRAALEYGYRNLAGTAVNANLGAAIGYQIPELSFDPTFVTAAHQLPPPGPVRYRVTASVQAPLYRSVLRTNFDFGASRSFERQFYIDSVTGSLSANVRPVRQFTLNFATDLQFNSLSLLNAGSIGGLINSFVAQYNAQNSTMNQDLCQPRLLPTPQPSGPLTTRLPGMQDGLTVDCVQPFVTAADIDRVRRTLLLPVGGTFLAAVRLTAALDLRDQAFNPTRGLYATSTLEFVNTLAYTPPTGGGDTSGRPGNTFRAILALTGYIPLPAGIVIASNMRAGFNVPLDAPNVTYPNRQFFLGGTDSMRGWLQDTFIPQEVVDEAAAPSAGGGPAAIPGAGDCTFDPFAAQPVTTTAVNLTQRGGDAMFVWRNELRVPVGQTGLAFALFADLGNLWKRVQNFNPFRPRAAAGLGVRYVTPIGPIALDYGFNLCQRRNVGEQPGALSFSIGVF